MTRRPRKRPRVAFAVGISVLGIVLAYFALERHLSPALGAVLSLVPPALIVVAAARRSSHRAWPLAVVVAVGAALALDWSFVERHFAGLFLVDHAGVNLALAWVFARTLAPGHEPLCTAFARVIHRGAVPPEVERYTRGVTVAWSVFFALVAFASVVLYAAGFHTAWSLLATVASPVLVGLMFAVEYAVRLRVLPHIERVGVLGGIVAFSQHFAARAQAPR